jgi:hypothetical protein
MLGIGFQGSPPGLVLRYPHPAASRDLHQIVALPLRGSFDAWPPLQDLSTSTAIGSSAVHRSNPLNYVAYLDSPTDLLISESIYVFISISTHMVLAVRNIIAVKEWQCGLVPAVRKAGAPCPRRTPYVWRSHYSHTYLIKQTYGVTAVQR